MGQVQSTSTSGPPARMAVPLTKIGAAPSDPCSKPLGASLDCAEHCATIMHGSVPACADHSDCAAHFAVADAPRSNGRRRRRLCSAKDMVVIPPSTRQRRRQEVHTHHAAVYIIAPRRKHALRSSHLVNNVSFSIRSLVPAGWISWLLQAIYPLAPPFPPQCNYSQWTEP